MSEIEDLRAENQRLKQQVGEPSEAARFPKPNSLKITGEVTMLGLTCAVGDNGLQELLKECFEYETHPGLLGDSQKFGKLKITVERAE